ncbi:MAG: nitroreductase [Syntrophales bacterium]|nr:nitroreductase [Syntrophales bacterium]MDD5234266.1 nitroreductase [Syntrophales bacterium]MDD5531800.1 nitroreductase [Syntrophales bacterium]
MNILETIKKRKSIRGYKPDPVPREILAEILETACRAPSAMNTQPWEFIVMTGDVLDRVKKANVEKLNGKAPMQPEHHVVSWPDDSVYRQRQVDLAKDIFRLMDIRREDREKRAAWLERGFRFFDAPAGIVVLTDRKLSDAGPLLDLGAVIQNICLAAMSFGLGTCIEDQGVLYPEVLREILHIPEDRKIIISIAVGYPDWNFPANSLEGKRVPVAENTRWLGF